MADSIINLLEIMTWEILRHLFMLSTLSNVGNLIYFKELEIILGSSPDYKNEKFKTKQKIFKMHQKTNIKKTFCL